MLSDKKLLITGVITRDSIAWEAARQAFSQSLAIARQINYARGEAYALRGLAAVAEASGDPAGALETLRRAETLQRQTPDAL